MKNHSTNYFNTFITIADDCPMHAGTKPSPRKVPTIAELQYKLLVNNPYKYSSDEVLFHVHTLRNEISEADLSAEEEKFFSKSQACFRASPLPKKYGWGVHFDKDGKMAIYGPESQEYSTFLTDPNLKIVKAMRSKKAL